MIGKTYDDVSEEIEKLDCVKQVKRDRIERILAGINSEDESESEQSSKSRLGFSMISERDFIKWIKIDLLKSTQPRKLST